MLENNKIKAGISIDGVQWGTMTYTVLTEPFAIIASDWDSSHPNFNKHIYRNRSASDFYNAKLLKSGHPNFMDIPLMIDLSLINECGSINPEKGFEITNKMILQFFDSYLLNKTNDLLNLNTNYKEIKIELLHKNQQNRR